jgi:hypothetical protein
VQQFWNVLGTLNAACVPMKAAGVIILVVALTVMAARAQPAPHNATAYPDVQDTPPRPEKPAMTADEVTRLKQDLSAARDRQQQPASPTPPRTPAKGTTAKIKRDR